MVIQQETSSGCLIACLAELSRKPFHEVYSIGSELAKKSYLGSIREINTWDDYINQSSKNWESSYLIRSDWVKLFQMTLKAVNLTPKLSDLFKYESTINTYSGYYFLDKKINGIAVFMFYINKIFSHTHCIIVKKGRFFETSWPILVYKGNWYLKTFGETNKQYYLRYKNTEGRLKNAEVKIKLARIISNDGDLLNLSKIPFIRINSCLQ